MAAATEAVLDQKSDAAPAPDDVPVSATHAGEALPGAAAAAGAGAESVAIRHAPRAPPARLASQQQLGPCVYCQQSVSHSSGTATTSRSTGRTAAFHHECFETHATIPKNAVQNAAEAEETKRRNNGYATAAACLGPAFDAVVGFDDKEIEHFLQRAPTYFAVGPSVYTPCIIEPAQPRARTAAPEGVGVRSPDEEAEAEAEAASAAAAAAAAAAKSARFTVAAATAPQKKRGTAIAAAIARPLSPPPSPPPANRRAAGAKAVMAANARGAMHATGDDADYDDEYDDG